MILVRIDPSEDRLKRLFWGWWNPGPKHRKMSKGTLLHKWGSTILVAAENLEALNLFRWLQQKEGREKVKLYRLTEVTSDQELMDIMEDQGGE